MRSGGRRLSSGGAERLLAAQNPDKSRNRPHTLFASGPTGAPAQMQHLPPPPRVRPTPSIPPEGTPRTPLTRMLAYILPIRLLAHARGAASHARGAASHAHSRARPRGGTPSEYYCRSGGPSLRAGPAGRHDAAAAAGRAARRTADGFPSAAATAAAG
jgi:hypothetical protein